MNKNQKLRVVDLFAGCGGMSLGFERAGFDLVGAFDFWKPAIDTYQRNFSHPILEADLHHDQFDIKALLSFSPDILIGGPPCQDFSTAGKRDESGGKADLTISFAKIVVESGVSFFVMENVDRIVKTHTYQHLIKIFKQAGFGLTPIILDASFCGVPQKRKRFFLIGQKGGIDEFLKDFLLNHQTNQPLTLRDYFGDSLEFEHYYRHPRNYNRRAIFSIDEPAPTMRGVNRPIPPGYKGHLGDSTPLSDKIHVLTQEERSWIQTFPKDFIFVGSKTNVEQMIGNAVPVELARYVGEQLYEYIQSMV